ncbi:MAG: cytochrome c oxidase subunit 3, partial [Gammaproteobacteria bacterium]|nr:cytochrome c oxidase subunit 3 [Gammaproteobacteria bacterium]
MATHQTYYVPEQSKWPIVGTVGLLLTMFGAGSIMVDGSAGKDTGTAWMIFWAGALVMAYMLFGWFGNVVRESRAGLYSPQMDRSFRWGMSWFIFSEVMFFVAFFGALFYARVFAVPWLGGEGDKGS